jgi:protein-tyrosine phosphatase
MIKDGYTYLTSDGRLAQGSMPPQGVHLPFDVIVLAAMEYQPELPGHEVLHVPLDDSGPPPTRHERRLIRDNAHRIARRLRAGKRVLVTCRQGKNRSGVLAGLALVHLGLPGPEAAERIQRLRGGLTNVYFREIVKAGGVHA